MKIVENTSEIIKVVENKDRSIRKYIHYNGSETTIKTTQSCVGKVVDGFLYLESLEKNKATVFISVSSGCKYKCKMCYLTAKRFPYKHLTEKEIVDNVIFAIGSHDGLKDRYIKLSFMGMGDVCSLQQGVLSNVVYSLVDNIKKMSTVAGIDSIDVGTCKGGDLLAKELSDINNCIFEEGACTNPINSYIKLKEDRKDISNRTMVRVFLSLHSSSQYIRKYLMPSSLNILSATKGFDIDRIFHYTLISSINDTKEDLINLKELMEKYFIEDELRVLRFNDCVESEFISPTEEVFINFIKSLEDSNFKVKYQVSTGDEIKAACGQFIAKEIN